jgi:uncharacterized membrane protein (UPF0182 family)
LAVLGVLVVIMLGLASVWTDVLWYSQLGYTSVFRTRVLTEVGLFLVVGLLTAFAVFISMLVAYRSRPVYAPMAVGAASLDRYRESIEPLRRLVGLGVPAMLGLFAGSAASQRWQTFLLWWNGVDFGRTDNQFGRDISFFVFTLPWLQFVTGLLTMVTFLAGAAALVIHYLYGGIRLQGPGQRFTTVARMQLAVIAAVFLLLRAVDFWLSRYAMTTEQSNLITGLTYTDANATLNARAVLAAIALVIAVLFVVAAFVDRWRMLPLYGLVLLVVSAVVVGALYPAAIQRFRVTPSPQNFELPYIKKNIDATREAYGLNAVQTQRYSAKTEASPADLLNDAEAIPGIRLLDPALVSDTFKQLEQNKQYYQFADALDVDRYEVDGVTRDVVVAVRELNLNGVPADKRNWFNDHFVYTHGFGLVAARGDQQTSAGAPVFVENDIPVRGALGEYEPRIYFGEYVPDYSIVGGPPEAPKRELDFPDDTAETQQANTTYTGEGGVSIGSYLRRVLFALKFREQNILLSEGINSRSRIMYDRSPRERVEKVAPYLTLDGDPYPSIVDGRVVWIVDGYTTSNKYPYSSLRLLNETTNDAITASAQSVAALAGQQVNYIRNSVKATVDAYDGSVTLYAWDETDPIMQAWRKTFPSTIKPLSAISADLMSHLRYPEDLFKVQRALLARYHVTDPAGFFSGGDFWQVPPEPTAETGAGAPRQPPYYLSIAMPGQDEPRFSLTSSFIPPQGGRNTLKGFLAVDADAGSAAGRKSEDGTLRLLQLPTDAIKGPGQMQNDFNANPRVTSALALLRGGATGASSVESGNMLVLPVADGLLYVQPVYVRGRGETSYPLLQRVLVGFGDKIGFAPTLGEALNEVFGTTGTGSGSGETPGTDDPGGSPGTGGAEADLQAALAEALQAVKDSETALAAGDFTKYGEAQRKLKDAVTRASAAQARLGETSSGATAPAASPSPSASPSP